MRLVKLTLNDLETALELRIKFHLRCVIFCVAEDIWIIRLHVKCKEMYKDVKTYACKVYKREVSILKCGFNAFKEPGYTLDCTCTARDKLYLNL